LDKSSSLLALQPCVGLGLLHGFVTVNFSGMWSLAPRPTLNLEDQELHFVWPLPFHLSGMGGPTRSYASASIALRVSGARKPPLHDKAVVVEEEYWTSALQNKIHLILFSA
jgi:hypothetical protein